MTIQTTAPKENFIKFEKDYPLASRLQPSFEQLPAVIERQKAVVMTAGAGTGKTRTLVARYLSLLEDGYDIRSIVAVTFTKKAASEMRNRIRAEIQKYIADSGLAETDLVKWRHIYGQLDFARISTIHGICSELLKYHPVEADIDPSFTVLEEREIAIMLRDSAETTVSEAAIDPEMQYLFDMISPERLIQVLRDLLVNSVESKSSFKKSVLINYELSTLKPRVLKKQALCFENYASALVQKGILSSLFQLTPIDLSDERAIYVINLQNLFQTLGYSPLNDSFSITDDVDLFESQIPLIHSIEKFSLIKGKASAWANGKEDKKESTKIIQLLRKPVEKKTDKLFFAFPGEHDQGYSDFLKLLKSLFLKSAALFAAMKKSSGGLDFNDLEYLALDAIQKNKSIRSFWNREVSWFLVDEFQDTNSNQRDLLTAMAGERKKLFLVGDAKQSIYGFRGADVSVFRKERLNAQKQGDRVLALTGSYRSHKPLMDTLNILFKGVFPDEDPNCPWLEPYQPLVPRLNVSDSGFTSEPFVEFLLATAAKDGPFENSREQAACATGMKILEWVKQGKCDFGDIAVLARAGNSFIEFEKLFSQMRIPFIVNAGKGYFDQPEVRDVLNALKAADKPYKTTALTGYLRSPATGLTDEHIFHIFMAYKKQVAHNEITLFDFLKRSLRSKSQNFIDKPGLELLGRAFDILEHIISIINRAPVERVISEFIARSDYFSFLIRMGLTRSRMNINKLIGRAHESRITDTGEFLAAIEESLELSIKESQANQTQKKAVQIMSAHASKGLEFPVVIIANSNYGKARQSRLVMDDFFGPVYPEMDDLKSPSIKYIANETESNKLDAEVLRLLYVAATRAKQKLVFTSPVKLSSKNSNQLSGLAGWLKLLFAKNCLDMSETEFPVINPPATDSPAPNPSTTDFLAPNPSTTDSPAPNPSTTDSLAPNPSAADSSVKVKFPEDRMVFDGWNSIVDSQEKYLSFSTLRFDGKVKITYYPESWKPAEEKKADLKTSLEIVQKGHTPYFMKRYNSINKRRNSYLYQRVKVSDPESVIDLAIESGTLVHNCLDAWIFPDSPENILQIKKYCRLHSMKKGITRQKDLELLEKRCLATLEKIRDCRWFCDFFENALKVYHEFPFFKQEIYNPKPNPNLNPSQSQCPSSSHIPCQKTIDENRLREVIFNEPHDLDPEITFAKSEKRVADAVVIDKRGVHHIVEFKTLRLPDDINAGSEESIDKFILNRIDELKYDIQLAQYGGLYHQINGVVAKLKFSFFPTSASGKPFDPCFYELVTNCFENIKKGEAFTLQKSKFEIKTVKF